MLAQAAVTISTMVLVLAGFTSMSLDSFEFILITGGLIRFFLILIALGGVVSMKMSFGSPTMTSFIKYTFCCAAAAGIIDNFILIYHYGKEDMESVCRTVSWVCSGIMVACITIATSIIVIKNTSRVDDDHEDDYESASKLIN